MSRAGWRPCLRVLSAIVCAAVALPVAASRPAPLAPPSAPAVATSDPVQRERDHLQLYTHFAEIAQRNPAALKAMIEADVSYAAIGPSQYQRLMQGEEARISRIVRVTGADGEDARADWPYPLRLSGQRALAAGWYRVHGRVRLDPHTRDEEGLPMTRIQPDHDGVLACTQPGCAERANALTMTRDRIGDPEWTPERAQQVIAGAPSSSRGVP